MKIRNCHIGECYTVECGEKYCTHSITDIEKTSSSMRKIYIL